MGPSTWQMARVGYITLRLNSNHYRNIKEVLTSSWDGRPFRNISHGPRFTDASLQQEHDGKLVIYGAKATTPAQQATGRHSPKSWGCRLPYPFPRELGPHVTVWPRSISKPSAFLTHLAVWPQQTWILVYTGLSPKTTKVRGCCAPFRGSCIPI